MDYYQLLGLSKTASDVEIKKAYRKLAMATHPDKIKGKEEEFKKYTEAYEVLIDPHKRKMYDTYGKVDNLKVRRSPDINLTLDVTLKDLYFGANKKMTYTRKVKCDKCEGKGTTKNIDETCKGCNGQGQVLKVVKNGFMVFQTIDRCPDCKGRGQKISKKDECKGCHGDQLVTETKELNVEVEKGIDINHILSYPGLSHILPDMISGDVNVNLNLIKDLVFERINNDLIINKTITLLQSLSGQDITIDHIN